MVSFKGVHLVQLEILKPRDPGVRVLCGFCTTPTTSSAGKYASGVLDDRPSGAMIRGKDQQIPVEEGDARRVINLKAGLHVSDLMLSSVGLLVKTKCVRLTHF